MPTGNPAPNNYFSNNVDYDISYINHVYLPVAIEADKPNVGYVGTFATNAQLLTKVQAFEDGSVLNGYFGGKGWPIYYTSDPKAPIDKAALVKLVGAQNIFADNTAASSYDLKHSMLSSSAGVPPNIFPATADDYAEKDLANYWFGWMKYYSKSWGQPIDPKLKRIMDKGGVPVKPVDIEAGSNMWTLANGQTKTDAEFAKQFSYTVYQVMLAFSNDGNVVFDDPAHPAVRSFLSDIIGNNIKDVADPATPAGILLTQEEIAILQGEPNTKGYAPAGQPDYSLPLDPVTGKYIHYPTPAGPTNAALWPVGKYNLDPQVWFVHQYLGAYSYAFSVDDNYGNVQVDQASGFRSCGWWRCGDPQ